MAGRLQGKSALVTAAGQGMGRAAVLAFGREGARVTATDLKSELLARLPAGITTRQLDVLDDSAVQAMVEQIGAVDILFNCAGYVHQGTILDCAVADWDFSFDLNVRSMFVLTKAMLPKMIAAGGGVTEHGLGTRRAQGGATLCASKACGRIHARWRSITSAEYPRELRVPGTVDTPSLATASTLSPIGAGARGLLAPADGTARTPEIAETFVYLAPTSRHS
jgi:NAD(P)-dependent dehydrogenase (short-subunit alcohol dehydrogenase family)